MNRKKYFIGNQFLLKIVQLHRVFQRPLKLQEAIALIQTDNFFKKAPTVWADLGCGSGLFTEALASLMVPESTIYAVDKNISSFKLKPTTDNIFIKKIESDFVNYISELKNLDGIMMANSLHFIKDKMAFLKVAKDAFRTLPCFLIVEYDTDMSNPWVPFPLSFKTLKSIFETLGYSTIRKLHEKKSLYNTSNIFSAIITH
jgi:ubiquinone/menaquinone biosynthesis C-methylase UbiE